jgi:hypothetical protein
MTLVYRVTGFLNENVTDLSQNSVEFDVIFRWNLDPSKNLPNILKIREVSKTKLTLPGAKFLSPAP